MLASDPLSRRVVELRVGIGEAVEPSDYYAVGRRLSMTAPRARRIAYQAYADLRDALDFGPLPESSQRTTVPDRDPNLAGPDGNVLAAIYESFPQFRHSRPGAFLRIDEIAPADGRRHGMGDVARVNAAMAGGLDDDGDRIHPSTVGVTLTPSGDSYETDTDRLARAADPAAMWMLAEGHSLDGFPHTHRPAVSDLAQRRALAEAAVAEARAQTQDALWRIAA
nr:hypothetical protein [Microbacterium lemovicicum]